MSTEKTTTVLLAVLAISASGVNGQVTSVQPLSLPLGGAMVCRAEPDPEGMLLEFTDSGKSFIRRESTLAYDTSGKPLQMAVSAEGKSAEGKRVIHVVVVRFLPVAEGAIATLAGGDPNFEMPLLRPEDTVENLPPGWKKATANDVRQARCLALDFWKRRCGKDVIPPPRPTGLPKTD